jgi:hydroxyethylthiazole kinase
MVIISELQAALNALRKAKPLVLSLTNVVTMDFMANCLLSIGAAPIMTQSLDEVSELLAISQAVNLNIGTLDKSFHERALQTASWAHGKQLPVILDPVGAGASQLRTNAAQSLLPFVDIIRGNSSEIVALTEGRLGTNGVESRLDVPDAMNAAQTLSRLQKVVVVSGRIDFVSANEHSQQLPFGSSLMSLVTGMGCTLTAVIAAFAGSGLSPYKAALYGTAYFGLCGETAALSANAPGSFRQAFIDTLYNPNWVKMQECIENASYS